MKKAEKAHPLRIFDRVLGGVAWLTWVFDRQNYCLQTAQQASKTQHS